MTVTIFFSWQNDTSTKEGRNLIEKALQQATKKISEDLTIEAAIREIEVDRDTKGVAGQPPIVDTIFKKIDSAAIFVPDLTFIGTRLDGRPTPNPNVLIEYGWALNSLGYGRIIPIMNSAYGEPTRESMPFNIGHLRNPITYNCPDTADDETRKLQRNALAKILENAIRDVLTSAEFKESIPKPPPSLPFPAKEPKDGQGKFRAKGQPIGIDDDRFFGATNHDVMLAEGAPLWLRVMPCIDIGKEWLIADLRNAATRGGGGILMPINSRTGGYSYVRNDDGFGIYGAVQTGIASNIVYVFTTGEVWTIDAYTLEVMKRSNGIPNYEEYFSHALNKYSDFLAKLGIGPPYQWIAGMEDIRGRGLYFPAAPGYVHISQDPHGKCVSDSIIVKGTYTPDTETAKSSLRPFFVKIFDSCGIERPQHLDSQ